MIPGAGSKVRAGGVGRDEESQTRRLRLRLQPLGHSGVGGPTPAGRGTVTPLSPGAEVSLVGVTTCPV